VGAGGAEVLKRFAFVLLLPLVAAACGGGSKHAVAPASPLDAVRGAAQKTAASGSAHLSLTAKVATGGQDVSLAGDGAFDTKAHAGTLHATFDASSLSGSIDEVLKGTDLYLKSDLFALALPAGKSWIKIDLAKTAASQGVNLRALLAQDPSEALQALQSLKHVTQVGTETIDGVSTTHYRAQVASSSQVPGGTYDVWVGDDGYVHRVRAVVAAGKTSSGDVKATVTTDLSKYGTGVSVTVPPAAQTYVSNGKTAIPGLGG
jgi:hypothetical protein